MKLEVFKSSYGYYNFRTVDGKPTEEMAEYLKTNGYRWSRNNNCWYPATAEAKEANLHDNFVLKFQEKFIPADVDQVKTEKLDSQSIDERITYLENLITELQEAHKQDLEKIRILENQLTNHEETVNDYYTQQEQSQLDEEAEWEKENSLTTEEEKEIIENQKNNVDVTPETTESLDSFFYDEIADDEDIYDERAQEDVHAGMVINPKELFEAAERIAREEEPEAERVFSENISENTDVEVTPDELSIAKAVLPTTQYVSTLRYSQGEEGNFFKQKIKDVAAAVSKAPKIGGTDGMEQHPIVLRYFHPTGTETLVTEIGKDGEAYGFQCLKGEYEMAEWGSIDLNEVKNIPGMELDYHIEEGMTVERWLYKEQPDMFPQYAKYAESTEKTPFDVAQDTGNDIEAIVGALNKNKPLFSDHTDEEKNEKKEFVPKPVSLETILAVMDMRPEMTADGKILVFDEQRKEYIDNGEDFEGNGQKAWEFSDAAEIFERLDIFIKEAFIDDMEDQLNAVGINYTEDGHARSLEECCELYKKEIENGNTQLSEGDLNLAFGIVNPETVILPEQIQARDELLRHVKYFVTEFAEFPSYDDTENMSLEDAVKAVRERNQQEHNFTTFGTNARFTVGIEIDGEKFGNDGASYNPETGNFETFMFEANSLFRKYGGVALEELAEEIKKQNNGLPPAMRLPCNFNPADFGLEENEEILIEAENGQMMTPDELRKWNEEKEMQHGQDSEFDEIKEGKTFALEAAKEMNSEQKKLNFVLDKLATAGIEVVQDKAEYDRILESHNILQKMETSSTEEKNPLFQADEKELKAFAQKVDDWKAGKLNSTEVISEFSTSTVLQAINIPANKVSVTQDVLHKINELETVKVGKSYGHDIDIATIKKIPEFLADPVMVFDSASKPGSYVIMSETVDKNNHTIMVAMEINKQDGSVIVNNITSAYGKKDDSFFIEQIKLGNLLYQNKQKSLEWTNERGFLLPPRLTTQGSLNVIQKEDIVNKRTVNFDLNERKIEFTENQQHFLKSIGFENSLNEDGSLSKSSFFIKNTEGKKNFLKINLNVNNNTAIFVKNEEAVDDFLIYDDSHKNFIEFSMIEEANANEPLVPAEALGKVLSDYALDRLVSVDDELMEEKFINKPDSIFVEDNLKKLLEEISFKNKVVNLPAKFISEDVYSSGIQPIGKVLQFVIHDTVANAAGLEIPKQKHYLLEIQTDNNYEYVHNKAYPRLYEAKWDRNSQSYIDVVELDLSNFDSITIGNIQYVAANNCNYPNPPAQTMTLSDGKTYGFAYEGKIYLNPEIMNSEVAMHEYTHLWDNYTQKTNPELWRKGKDIFKNTHFWNDVKSDPNYTDIAENDDLLLSEVHAQICGKMADTILSRIAERDGDLTKDTVIDWDKEVDAYIYENFESRRTLSDGRVIQSKGYGAFGTVVDINAIRSWFAQPMKDFMNGVHITKNISVETAQKHLTSKKDIKAIREQCRQILKKPDSEITESDKAILAQYEGAGGLNEENRTNAGILNEFYTPNNLVDKVWQIVDAYAPEAKTVLEPSAGVGKFANNRPNNEFTMHELDEISARINKILHPEAKIIQGAYQKQFFDDGERFKRVGFVQPKYDVVIGNPPYGAYNDKYKGLGEGKEFDRYEEYFISKGLDALKDENSVMAFVVPSGFLNTASDKQKELIASKGRLIDAYRLPVGTFPTTEVGTDIIIMKPWKWEKLQAVSKEEMAKIYANEMSNGDWFLKHPEKILGEVKTRINRFGKEEEYVAVHEGLSVQDELNKIDELVKQNAPKFDVEMKKELVAAYNGITKALEEVYPNDPEKVTERTLEFSEAIKSMDFHKLGGFILWTTEKDEPVKQAAIKVFEEKTGKQIPVYENIDKYEANHLTAVWLAHNTNIKNGEIYNFSSEQDVISYIVSSGTGTENGKERVNKFFAETSDKSERIKFLINEYGWYGHHAGVFGMECKNNASGIEVKAYINEPLFDLPQKLEKNISWTAIHDEIERQRIAGIYLDEPHSENREVDDKTKSHRPKKEKWNIAKSKGEVMTAEEFSRLYGRDFDEREFPIWRATDWQGNINLENLSAEDLKYMHESGRYVQKDAGEWTHKVLFTSGNIYEKIEIQKMLRSSEISRNGENSEMAKVFEKNIELLELSKKTPLDIEHIHFGLKTTLAEDFTITHFDEDGNPVELNLQESFILWAQNATLATQRWRKDIDYATSNISREELGEELTFYDIVDYIDGKSVKAEAVRGWRTWDMSDEEKAAEKAERKKEADLKRQTRADTANRLFDRYLHEGLDENTKKRLEAEYNRRFNSYISPDYSKLPLFVDGMSAYKGNSKFKLYDQQIKGISFLCNKGNGLLAYDVGVGKTAAGIVATVNQIQTERSKRPLIIVPNQVYAKWYTDIKQLFPNVQVNDLYNFNKKSVEGYVDKKNPHKLNIPENSISLCTYEALKNITFTDESCENALYQDFANLLSADFDGSDKENATSSDKIKGIIGSASHVKDSSYYFFEECGFDNLTVDEAHHFKNLWVVPKPKNKGDSNEYSGIPSGKPSARALKMYGMTQLVQRNNDNRNVFMLTATPFTNSPTEVYSMLSYIGRERLHEAGISSLRSFFDEFAQTRQELGVNAKGEIDTKQVMKSWKELPALQSILTEFIDKVDGEEAGIIRPNKFTHVKQLDMSELQKQMREIDEERMAEVKEGNSAAVIVAMNNMRLSCVAPALANPAMYPGVDLPPLSQLVETSPKLKFVCDAIIDMYKDNPEKGQFMYVPLGKESHGIIKDYLVAHGIPKEAVEIINGEINSTTEKKEKISGRFNDEKDKVKILIGGQNTTEGIDLNGNSFVMYNCSLGWNPSETIQAEGRIWRQGNLQGNVHVVYPVMNDSIDSVLYQKHDEKRSRINEIWNYKGDSLNIEDINPEDLKLDLIKDPVKKSKLILQEETKEARLELSKINLKIKSFDEIIEKRKQLSFDFDDSEKNIQKYERQINEYKENGLEVPEWIKSTLKGYKKDFEKASNQKLSVEKKLASWNCNTPEEEDAYIHNLNNEKHFYEEKIQHIEEGLPEILKKLEVERLEQKIMEYPVDTQREILEADILNNLRPMSEVKHEIKTKRHENMLAEKLKAGEISQEEHDLYKSAGYEKYEKWLNGEIESLEDGSETHIANQEVPDKESDRQLSVENDTADIIDKKAQTTIPAKQPQMENDPYNGLDLFTSMGISEDEMFVHSAEQLYFNFDKDDIYLTPEQLTKAEQKRDEIILPVLKGKETGMYKAFNNFVKHGVFDVLGTKIDMEDTPKGPAISADGWNQLHAAMNIYRDKSFETMRYVFVDRKSGEIKDQFAISSKMPNYCLITESYNNGNETIKELIMKAEETDSLIVAVHNHPSGNVTESMEDIKVTETLNKSFTRSDGLCRFGGHIILDHDNFNLWTPYTKTLKETKGWVTITDWERFGKKDELINENFNFPREDIGSTDKLFNVAKKINDTNSWNDDFIPVIFSNADAKICALQFYDKSFFDKDPQFIRNKLQFSGIESGAIRAFPVVTEACMNKLSGLDAHLLEEKMKNLVAHSAFSDAVLPDSTIVKKYNVTPGINLFSPDDIRNKKPDVQATWDRQIMNPTLFEQLQNGTLRIIVPEEEAKINERTKLKKASGMDY